MEKKKTKQKDNFTVVSHVQRRLSAVNINASLQFSKIQTYRYCLQTYNISIYIIFFNLYVFHVIYIDQYFSFTFSFCNKINNKINKSFVFLITDIIVSTGNVRNSARHTNEKYIKVSVSIIVIIYSSFVSSCCFASMCSQRVYL